MFICCGVDSFLRGEASLPQWKSLREGGIFWQGLLNTCDCRHCLDASAWFLQQLTVFIGRRLVYASCTGCQIIDQNACETQDRVCCVFGIYTPALEMLQEMPRKIHPFWENYLKSSLLPHIPQWTLPITTHWKACLDLPAGAVVSHEWVLCCIYVVAISTVNRKCLGEKSRLCENVCTVCVCTC